MLKTDYKKEVENTLSILTDKVDEALADGNYKEAIDKIETEMKSLAGIDLMTLNTLSFDSVKGIISRENQYNSIKYVALGETLRLIGKVYFSMKEEGNALYYYEKSAEAFLEANAEEDIEEEFYSDIEIVLEKLQDYDLEVDKEIIDFKLYGIIGKFDKAEDLLFGLLDKTNNEKEIIDMGLEFYDNLLTKSEEELEQGNLPLDEVKDSKTQLQKIN